MNEYTAAQRANRYAGAKLKSNAQTAVAWAIRAAHIPPLKPPVTIEYRFFEPNRRRDHDNISAMARKVVQDALVECRVLKNDGWGYIAGYTDAFAVDAKNPRIEITITEENER